jgi:hypothetical protein
MSPKQNFLTVYDYGTGGVWTIIKARSADEITTKYPKLVVLNERPNWMDDKQYEDISRCDIDDPPDKFLSGMKA